MILQFRWRVGTGPLLALLLSGVVALPACNEEGARPTTVVAAIDSADQVLYGFVHFLTRNGVREAEIRADTAFFYDPSQTAVLRNMKLVSIDSIGQEMAVITSHVGTYKWQTGNMVAEGNVIMTGHDGRVLKTEKLTYDATKKEISSDVHFTYDCKASHLEGMGFRSDMSFENIVASKPKGKADDGVALPGQDAEPGSSECSSVVKK